MTAVLTCAFPTVSMLLTPVASYMPALVAFSSRDVLLMFVNGSTGGTKLEV